jgi:hypothetical protein
MKRPAGVFTIFLLLGGVHAAPRPAAAEPLAPLCSEVEASLTPSAEGFPPLPTNSPPAGSPTPGDITKRAQDIPILGGGYFPWIQRAFVSTSPAHVDAARIAFGSDPANAVCIHVSGNVSPVAKQPDGGDGWRLIAAGPFDAKTIAVSATPAGHQQLLDAVGVPAKPWRTVGTNDVLVAYAIHPRGGCVADRVTGFTFNSTLNTFQVTRAPGPPTDSCPLKREPWAVVVAVDRSLFPNRKVIFRSCQRDLDCSWTYLLADFSGEVAFDSVNEFSRPVLRSGTCSQQSPTLNVPPVLHCEVLTRFDAKRFVGAARFSGGQVVFYLLSPRAAPIELPGQVIAARPNTVAMLHGNKLRVRRGNRTTEVLTFTEGLPRANSSGREGAINPSGTRVAVFLQAPGASRDSGSVAVGLVDIDRKTMRVVPTTEWQNPMWTSDSVLRVGSIEIDALNPVVSQS